MKIFITHASAGAGHFKAAEALYRQFHKNNPGLDLRLIDILDYSNPLFKNSYIYGYNLIINYAPWLWALPFSLTANSLLKPITSRIRFIIDILSTSRFRKLVIRENPDFIISTHFLPSELASYLKKIGRIKSKLITVITDFGAHPFWILDNTDIYVGASEATKKQLILAGVKENNIRVLGIPVDYKFHTGLARGILFKKFGLDEGKFTVLIVTGSFGIGPIEQIVDTLYLDVQLLVVCARNQRLFERLERKNYPGARVFGFIDNMEELMGISDVIITKPGGLSISEILVMELVPIFISPIPGQETENVKIMHSYGIGEGVKDIAGVRNIILDYKEHPDKLNRIKEFIRRIKKPSAAEGLYNVICQNSFRAAC